MADRRRSRFQLIPGPEPCQGLIVRGVELAPGAHASARSSLRPPRRAHRRGHCRRAGVLVVEIGRPYPGFFFSSDFRVFPVDCSGPRGRPRVRRPDRGRGRSLPHLTDGARRGRSRPHPLRGRARRPPLRPRAGPGPSRGACSSTTSPPTSPCPRSCWRRGSSSSPRTRGGTEPQLPRLHVSLGRVQRGRARGGAGAEEVRGLLVSFVPPRCCPSTAGSSSYVPGEPRAPAWLDAAPRDPAALPRGVRGRPPVVAVFMPCIAAAPGLLVNGWLYPAAVGFRFASARSPSRSRSGRCSTRAGAPPRRSSTSRPPCSCSASRSGSGAGWLHARAAHPALREPDRPAGGLGAHAALPARPSATPPCATASSTPPW